MSADTATTFFALLTLAANAGVAATAVLALSSRWSGRAAVMWERLRDSVTPWAVPLALAVAAGAMAGSLYYSEHVGFEPCTLCWYQRIAIYPVVPILAIAWWRRDHVAPRRYALPLTVIAGLISGYHYLIQRVPSLETGVCATGVPCSSPYLEEFGFVTMAYMGIGAAALIVALLLTAKSPLGPTGTSEGP